MVGTVRGYLRFAALGSTCQLIVYDQSGNPSIRIYRGTISPDGTFNGTGSDTGGELKFTSGTVTGRVTTSGNLTCSEGMDISGPCTGRLETTWNTQKR